MILMMMMMMISDYVYNKSCGLPGCSAACRTIDRVLRAVLGTMWHVVTCVGMAHLPLDALEAVPLIPHSAATLAKPGCSCQHERCKQRQVAALQCATGSLIKTMIFSTERSRCGGTNAPTADTFVRHTTVQE